jgi:signal transduction histidine kinase
MSEPMKILIIDDSPDDRDLCRRALRTTIKGPLQFVEASTGESGLESIARDQPTCVLLDYSLPGNNGIEILKRLRERHPYVPVVMLTGYGNEAVAVSAMHEGAQNYINKSAISIKPFEQAVRAAIEHCALEKRVHDQHESLEMFSRALTHDLKEPIRTIRSYVELISQSELSTPQQGHFEHIRAAIERMAMLVDMVFRYTQLDSPDSGQRAACDLNRCLADAQHNLRGAIVEHRCSVTATQLPVLQANGSQMIQLFQNLIANAIRHGQPGVTVHVGAEKQPGRWLISVSDNGPGIAAADRERIFTPFKRLAEAKEEGAGLGLAICRRIVEGHDGRIWCEPGAEGGANFVISLPVGLSVGANESSSASERNGHSGGRIANVLLVDDRSSDLEYTELMLTKFAKLQCKILLARDGYEALETVAAQSKRGQSVDLMLLDVNMPGTDGFEVLEQLARNELLEQVAVVMCTGSDLERDKQRARTLGAAGYLVKPPRFDKLRPIIERVPTLQLQPLAEGYALRVVN